MNTVLCEFPIGKEKRKKEENEVGIYNFETPGVLNFVLLI
jgi:hypothetical protein